MQWFITFLFCTASYLLFSQDIKQDTFLVFYLGGQSNMNGSGKNDQLPSEFKETYRNTWIFQGNPLGDQEPDGGYGRWAPLTPGHGAGFSSDGQENKLSDYFGPELGFAKTWQQYFPGQKVALIKYARGGSSIDSVAARHFGCWEPDFKGENGINQYDHFLTTLRHAFTKSDINGDGRGDYLQPAGILWMQGESDGDVSEAVALRYYHNLKRLMDLIRSALRYDDLPIVIGRISESGRDEDGVVWTYGDHIRKAQAEFVEKDERAALVTDTDKYGYSDPWHYDSSGYLELGKAFAEAMISLWK